VCWIGGGGGTCAFSGIFSRKAVLCVRSRSLLPIVVRLSRPYKALSMPYNTGNSSRSAIINCRLCCQVYCKPTNAWQSVLLSQNDSHPQVPPRIRYIQKQKTPEMGVLCFWWRWWVSVTQGGRAALATKSVEKYSFFVFARSREPTIMRVFFYLPRSHIKKDAPKASIYVVEVVGLEPTSYAAAKKLSTYLVCLLFLIRATRINTLYKPQKAEYSFKNAFRSLKECSV